MNDYQINIINMTHSEEMFDIQQALASAGVAGDDAHDIGVYLRDGEERAVFVAESDLSAAVRVINELGFQTDEDE